MNESQFVLAADGGTQVTPCGEFPHTGAGVTQVIDREACDRIAADFNGRKSDANFPGVLVDFDHFSLDTEKSSEVAGWISEHPTAIAFSYRFHFRCSAPISRWCRDADREELIRRWRRS